jgi:GR25 family glycosyltransferase involved in LPS biosynthesis
MINLDQRPEKFTQSSEQLHSYGIFPYRFSAVNGWELTVEAINDIGLKYQPGMTPLMATTYPPEAKGKPSYEFMSTYGKTYFCHCLARGTMGCYLSHVSVLKDAYDSGYETIWVMEDDIEVLQDPRRLSELLETLDQLVGRENWDVLFTDQNYRKNSTEYIVASGATKRPDMDCSLKERTSEKYTCNMQISPDFRKVSARFGTHSMIIRRSGIKKLLDFALRHQIYLPYDMDNYLDPLISRYSVTEDIVSNMLHAISDNGFPNYEKK